MNKVFLGGTCSTSTWRDKLIPLLQLDFFNPVVENWTPDCIEIENKEKEEHCNIHLYVITKEMKGVYSIAEMVQSSLDKTKTTIVQIIPDGFDPAQLKSLEAVVKLLHKNRAIAYIDNELGRTLRVLHYAYKISDFY